MATPLGTSKQGRKKEALRLTAASLASEVSNPGGFIMPTIAVFREDGTEDSFTIQSPEGKANLPKGSVVLDHKLTNGKTVVNVREIVRLALIDAGMSDTVSLRREAFRFDAVYGENGYTPTAAEKRKGYASTGTDAPTGDVWILVPKVAKDSDN